MVQLKVAIIIPTRYSSTRFEGKILADICGKPMIYHVWKQSLKAKNVNEVFVATDDERIKKVVENFGGKVIMTSPKHFTGTDRVAEAAEKIDADIIINVQGDEPLLHPEMIEQVVVPLVNDSKLKMTQLVTNINHPADFIDNTVVKVVMDKYNDILFFSRASIPYPKTRQNILIHKVIGIYAFRKDFLLEYVKMAQTPLELVEGIEQLRVIENRIKMKAVETKHESFSVNVLSDLFEVRRIMETQNKEKEIKKNIY